ncbi:TetR/AcrR family transcriptional regulator [Pseudonocardia sp. KRD291]|uniref:TetR/AcrR family transcriptional regulator n=1 Tax=Pseudonocardia sp. KRD291 TaxID=2792007 RepID=UPI001C4A1E6A|nr:TetR/AcrR family transcriptional regulator [Pseudonocardia sp. KRD291]MBW0104965.1 TetR/AcrR family transcriptional regulator [Pseudonocardia sp. KRD291]
MSTSTRRGMRADAARNRELLLDAALAAFAADGTDATLDGIAKSAGVGIGTLYRHFPTREALVEAVYRNELDRLCDAADDLLTRMPADAALRAWMDRFVDYMVTKKHMADALRAVVASGGTPFAHSRERMGAAVGRLLAAGAADGTLRPDLAPSDVTEPGATTCVGGSDVLVGMSGVCMTANEPDGRAQAGRLLDLLVEGLRAR